MCYILDSFIKKIKRSDIHNVLQYPIRSGTSAPLLGNFEASTKIDYGCIKFVDYSRLLFPQQDGEPYASHLAKPTGIRRAEEFFTRLETDYQDAWNLEDPKKGETRYYASQ